MARKPRMKPKPQAYLRLQSSAMARSVMEPAIERYLDKCGIAFDTSNHPSGLRTYFVPVGPETDWQAIVQGFSEPLVGDAPSLTHLFWSYDPGMGKSWNCGASPKQIRRGRPVAAEPDTAAGTTDTVKRESTQRSASNGASLKRTRIRNSGTPQGSGNTHRRRLRNSIPTVDDGASPPTTRTRRRIKQ